MAGKIKLKVFDALRESLEDALAFERGAGTDLRVTRRESHDNAKRHSNAHGG